MSELTKNPKWTIDETILCLDFYFKYRPSIPGKNSKELSKLHALIQKFNEINNVSGSETFRNYDGIYMKLMNLMHLDPSAKSGLPRNSKVDHEVWEKYSGDINALSKLSSKIQNLIENEGQELKKSIISDDELESYEGRVIFKKHKVYERDQKLVKQKKQICLKKMEDYFVRHVDLIFMKDMVTEVTVISNVITMLQYRNFQKGIKPNKMI